MRVRFDAIALHVTVIEMNARLAGGKIRRIQQLAPDLLAFTVFRPRTSQDGADFTGPEARFLICLGSSAPRIHLAEREYGTADTPNSFCMLLRKHLEGARIATIRTLGLERLVRIDLLPHPEREAGALVVTLIPNRRQLVLLDPSDRVMGEMRHQLRKGEAFSPPVTGLPHALELPGAEMVEALRALERDGAASPARAAEPLARAMPRVAFGLGVVAAREIAVRAGAEAGESFDETCAAPLAKAWDGFWRQVREGPRAPLALDVEGDERLLLPFPYVSLEGTVSAQGTMSLVVESAFTEEGGQAGLEVLRGLLLAGISRARDRVVRRAAAQERDLEKAEQFEQWRQYGDLLTANMYRVPHRATEITLEDYMHDGALVRIPLDPDKSASENAQAYYERYRKSKRGVDAIADVITRSQHDIAYLDSLASSVETAVERDELREIEAQMMAEGLLSGTPRKRPRSLAAKPRRYEKGGYDILVGRNPRQNELLTLRMARPEDWWLHARQIPGAHVVIRGKGGEAVPPDDVIRAAARLAAGFSRAASAGRVAVDYTRVKHVKKPPGTPAGYVTYSREQTVDVAPGIDLEEAAQ